MNLQVPEIYHAEGQVQKPLLRIALADYWYEMVPEELLVTDPLFVLLSRHFELLVTDDPDILFFSVFGEDHTRYNCLKVCYTGENRMPPPSEYDYSFSFSKTDSINFFHPFFARDPYFGQFKDQNYSPKLRALRARRKSRFCAFIYSNDYPSLRKEFCRVLSQYKAVSCPGNVLNNRGSSLFQVGSLKSSLPAMR